MVTLLAMVEIAQKRKSIKLMSIKSNLRGPIVWSIVTKISCGGKQENMGIN